MLLGVIGAALLCIPSQDDYREAVVAGKYCGLRSHHGPVQGLSLDSDHRFVKTVGPRSRARVSGTWSMVGRDVILRPDSPPHDSIMFEPRYTAIRWDRAMFLVEASRMAAFAADAKVPFIPGQRNYLVRSDIREEIPNGSPELPGYILEFYEKGMIQAQVVSINFDRTVELNTGSEGRLKKGMILAGWQFDAEIVSISKSKATARLWYYWFSTLGPSVGETVTSGTHRCSPRPASLPRYPYLVDVPKQSGPS